MNTYEVRVRLPQGGFADVKIHADHITQAKSLAEAMYGSHNVIAVLGEAR